MTLIKKYLNTLYKLERTGMKYDLKNIKKLLTFLNNPHHHVKFIHIAGTNGKGGTASFLTSILMEHGLKTGLYSSPHLLKFNERIQINGKFISDNYIKNFYENNINLLKKINVSFFEAATALAFKYFADNNVDIAIIETGLGGRLDSTNVIKADLCIITQISIDHTQYLGKSLKSIAKEKFGIVKNTHQVPVVIISDNNKELYPFFKNNLKKGDCIFLDENVTTNILNDKINYTLFEAKFKFDNNKHIFKIPLTGIQHVRNAETAILAAKEFLDKTDIKFDYKKAQNGLHNVIKNTFYHGRFEIIKAGKKNYIFDVSHNPDAIKRTLDLTIKYKIDSVIFGIMEDKDYKSALNNFKELNSPIIFTKPKYHRARNPKDLYIHFLLYKNPKNILVYFENSMKKAIKLSNDFSTNKGYTLILGSFFIVSDAIKILKLQKNLKH